MKPKLVVIGAGGHARSVLDIILQNNEYDVAGCVDNIFPEFKHVPNMEEISIIGNDELLPKLYDSGINNIFVAIGNNKLRASIYEKAVSIGFEPVSVISRHAVISPRAYIGSGTCVMAGAVINVNCSVGNNCIINTNSSLDHDCTVGNHCHVAPGVAVSGTVNIGDCVHLGTGTNVINGISIGKNSFIGVGSAVVKNIPEGVLAYGVPAKIIKECI